MNFSKFEKIINEAFEVKETVNADTDRLIIDTIKETIELTDQGKIRVAEKKDGSWVVNQWVKKAILLSFKINKMQILRGPYTSWYDKVPGKSVNWEEEDWKNAVLHYEDDRTQLSWLGCTREYSTR